MNPTTNSLGTVRLPEIAAEADRSGTLNNVFAIAGVVIKEMYRRKDFYVLFVLTALITLLMGSVTFFNQENKTSAADDERIQLNQKYCARFGNSNIGLGACRVPR